jgi:acyl CoA:acetate/3-ketoacid CoA transferase beta subunit
MITHHCIAACADLFRDDGEILASPIGLIPLLGVKLARRTFAPDLLLMDGDKLVTEEGEVEGWLPFRFIFDWVWHGKRHVVMGASQIDRHGNQNISAIGDFAKPKAMLVGMRGAPGNTVNHPTSYFIPNHTTRTFVPKVDVVCGVASKYLRRVVSNKGIFDFEDGSMRLLARHPGVEVDDIVASTGFPLVVPGEVPISRALTSEELAIVKTLDPEDKAARELPS